MTALARPGREAPGPAADSAGTDSGPQTGAKTDPEADPVAGPDPVVEPDPDSQPGPLQRLVQERMADRGWSYGEIARRSGLPRSTVHHLATAPTVRAPRPALLQRMAQALELPLATLQAAAARAAGLSVDSVDVDPDTAVLMAGIAELSAEDRRHVGALIASLRAAGHPRGSSPA